MCRPYAFLRPFTQERLKILILIHGNPGKKRQFSVMGLRIIGQIRTSVEIGRDKSRAGSLESCPAGSNPPARRGPDASRCRHGNSCRSFVTITAATGTALTSRGIRAPADRA